MCFMLSFNFKSLSSSLSLNAPWKDLAWPGLAGPLIKYFKYQTEGGGWGERGGGLQLIGSQSVSRWDEKNQ